MAHPPPAPLGLHESQDSTSPGAASRSARALAAGLSADAVRYRFLAERLSEVVFQLGPSGHITFLGPAWTALTGLPVESTQGRLLIELLHLEDRPRVQALLDTLAARVQTSFQVELRLQVPAGTRWVVLTAHGSPTGQGEVLGLLADVTERHLFQDYLRRSEGTNTLGMLVPGFAHEMNNPLAFMSANVNYLLTSMEQAAGGAPAGLVAQWREAVQEVREGSERLQASIAHLRSFRPQPGQGPVEVNQLLDSVAQMVSGVLRSRGRLVRDYGASSLVADGENGLRQVLLNLVFHAVLSLPEDGDTEVHQVRLVTREDGQGHVVIEVHDSGPGLPPERLARVFEPFFAAHGDTQRPELSVCQDIVRGLGGGITASSTPGRGCVFRVTLPVLS